MPYVISTDGSIVDNPLAPKVLRSIASVRTAVSYKITRTILVPLYLFERQPFEPIK